MDHTAKNPSINNKTAINVPNGMAMVMTNSHLRAGAELLNLLYNKHCTKNIESVKSRKDIGLILCPSWSRNIFSPLSSVMHNVIRVAIPKCNNKRTGLVIVISLAC